MKGRTTPLLKKAMPYLKIVAVILYFTVAASWFWGAQTFGWYRGSIYFFPNSVILLAVMLYGLTWLYKITVKGTWRGEHGQSVLYAVILTGIWIAFDVCHAVYFGGANEAYNEYLLYRRYLNLIYMVLVVAALFFAFGHRRFALNRKTGFLIASGLLLVVILVCIAVVLLNIREMPRWTSDIDVDMFSFLEITLERRTILQQFNWTERVMGLALYACLWINTLPKKKEA